MAEDAGMETESPFTCFEDSDLTDTDHRHEPPIRKKKGSSSAARLMRRRNFVLSPRTQRRHHQSTPNRRTQHKEKGRNNRTSVQHRDKSASNTPISSQRTHSTPRMSRMQGAGSSSTPLGRVREFISSSPIDRVQVSASSLSTRTAASRVLDSSSSSEDEAPPVKSVTLNDVHSMLEKVVQRVDGTEKEVKQIKQSIRGTSSCDKKTQVSRLLRSETRKMYKALLDAGENFSGFAIGPSYTWHHEHNKEVVRRPITEVQAINSDFLGCSIRSAAYTYYKTLTSEESLQRRGKSDCRKRMRRKRERMNRKLQQRLSVFKKRVYESDDEKKWKKILVIDMMSSEDSETEGEGGGTNYVKDIPWRADVVKDFFDDLDRQHASGKSSQAKRQTKRRLQSSEATTRPVPAKIPTWALK